MPTGSSTPPPLPPREPHTRKEYSEADATPLSYFVPPPPVGWAVAGVFSVSEWHVARVILAKRGILARIGNAVDETGHTVELLVPAAQEAYARSLLAGGIHQVAGPAKGTGGFPVLVANDPPQPSTEIPFANPVPTGLSPRQIMTYNIVVVFLWLLLIFVVLLIAVPIVMGIWGGAS
jgi:hypothetical protein